MLLLFSFSKYTKFGLPGGCFFNEIVVFALKTPQKIRLRRAAGPWFLLFSKNFRLRRAFIIFHFSKSSCFYYFLKILTKFLLAFIILLLRGGSYY